jgi:adenylate cyclase
MGENMTIKARLRTPGAAGRYKSARSNGSKGFFDTRALLSSKQFFDALRARRRDNADAVDARIERQSVQEATVLMCDSSGFTRKTNEYGVLQFLAVMTYCYDNLIPIIEKTGICLSHNADNLFAIFEQPADAIAAAVGMHQWLRAHNEGKPDSEQYNVCIGIHHGELLRLKDNVYGGCVNVAAKVGEDLAAKDEILITSEVAKRAGKRFKIAYARSTPLGGRTVELYTVKY